MAYMWRFAWFGTICKILKTWKNTHWGVLLLVFKPATLLKYSSAVVFHVFWIVQMVPNYANRLKLVFIFFLWLIFSSGSKRGPNIPNQLVGEDLFNIASAVPFQKPHYYVFMRLLEKCPNEECFSGPYILCSVWARKMQTRKNSVFGHLSHIILILVVNPEWSDF